MYTYVYCMYIYEYMYTAQLSRYEFQKAENIFCNNIPHFIFHKADSNQEQEHGLTKKRNENE